MYEKINSAKKDSLRNNETLCPVIKPCGKKKIVSGRKKNVT